MEDAGGVAYAAEIQALARQLLKADPLISIVMIDARMIDLHDLVGALRARRPKLTIVGTSGEAHAGAFAAVGVERTVPAE